MAGKEHTGIRSTNEWETIPKRFEVVNEGTGVWKYGRVWGYCEGVRTFVFSLDGENEDYRVDLNIPSFQIVPAIDGTMEEVPDSDLDLALLIFMSELRVGVLILDMLTIATTPLSANDIAEKIASDKGIDKNDNFNLERFKKMVFASLERWEVRVGVERVGKDGLDILWKIKPKTGC